ncbi:unnamed protein product [Urochloa humidicola]
MEFLSFRSKQQMVILSWVVKILIIHLEFLVSDFKRTEDIDLSKDRLALQRPWNADKQEASARNAAAGVGNQLADNDPVDARWQLQQQWWRLR